MDKQCPPSSGLEDVHPPTYPPSPSPSAAAWSRVSACGQIFPTFSRQRTIIKHQPSLPLCLPSKGYSLQTPRRPTNHTGETLRSWVHSRCTRGAKGPRCPHPLPCASEEETRSSACGPTKEQVPSKEANVKQGRDQKCFRKSLGQNGASQGHHKAVVEDYRMQNLNEVIQSFPSSDG